MNNKPTPKWLKKREQRRLRPKKQWAKKCDFMEIEPKTGETANQKGATAERNVCEVLARLRNEGIIKGYRRTRKYGKRDRKGIDILVFFEWGRRACQVKSSRHYLADSTENGTNRKIWNIIGFGDSLEYFVRRMVASMAASKD